MSAATIVLLVLAWLIVLTAALCFFGGGQSCGGDCDQGRRRCDCRTKGPDNG
ncbi:MULTISPECIES: hypothetical protein [unclassified Janthinobacterium]|uniref:hypothetical protein n=1 Tax=unclassified Janthinobacterium TaxID=2610881 RepID=UPI00034D0EAB|nr:MULTISPECIES: hypothetical protein [unclassified Janthinobacterium]MEC5161685.1 hypothetical protein [Janthinobacterium sp. CG_S6]